MSDTLYVFYMKSQGAIQAAMTELITELSEREIKDKSLPIIEILKDYPDLKVKWDILMKEAEELRSKGMWKSG
jgi:hypothetical protein